MFEYESSEDLKSRKLSSYIRNKGYIIINTFLLAQE